MKTQADKLQQIVEENDLHPEDRGMKIVAITSGKGGVGKSTVGANIASMLADEGYKVAIFDADIGLANLDIIFNVKTQYDLLNVLEGECSIKDIVVPIKKNLLLIPGESGDEILRFDDKTILERLQQEAEFLDALDYLIIDTGAGIGENVQLFLKAADEIIVVTMPDPSAITDAYATIKVASRFNPHISMIINMVKNSSEGQIIYQNIKKVADENLETPPDLTFLGAITQDSVVSKSTKYRKLFTQEYPNSVATFELREIIQNLIYKLEHKVLALSPGKSFTVFVRRLIDNF
ncbi:MAG: ATP-binding protein [Campylobacteraceae bacterium 4484_4]|nr:MAG: ATP-binding protein [Campylobacteraceae bacterium 4484_4]